MINNEYGYHVKAKSIPSSPGCWNKQLIEIFYDEIGMQPKVGEFERDYPSYGESTFFPFTLNGKDYALFSKHYEDLSIMTLPDCKELELTKESRENLHSFCPVRCYVPKYKITDGTYLNEHDVEKSAEDYTDLPWIYHGFGFVQGCVWGDDTGNFSLNFLNLNHLKDNIMFYGFDLSKINEKGTWTYLQLPVVGNFDLKASIHIDDYGDFESTGELSINVSVNKSLDGFKDLSVALKDAEKQQS